MTGFPASAQETTTYTYDALGRLIETDVSSSTRSSAEIEIQYDDVGNRVRYESVAAPGLSQELRVIPVTGGKVVVVIF
ncbi:hypothetical protein [Parasphingopyxis algicola]|uniref:hypothetical protein n=1 Tax=Parasphingopyxis algicola TaxID=2026624 RepID=UPI001C40A137|nr:hypothetical protein [Parasphingopyxis algicola]